VSRLALETELRVAIERGELYLAYQPKVDLTTGLVDGIEALMRWQHPALGAIPPNTFIPIAEETGLIAPIGLFALESACGQAARWHEQGFQVAVSVNLSGRQLADPRLVGEIGAILDQQGLAPHRLCLELTESVLMAESTRAPAALSALKELGLRLSIDDFGTGYSSLSYLQRFPVDELKIDRTFVHDLTDNQAARNLAAAIVAMGNALGLQVVAEGVETAAQARELRRIGCRSAQGYLFSRPGPPAAVTSIMRAGAVPPLLSSPP
jgi:EAL domain-containing protein (putative c-di-GMP-specific phosphodiesterase class I)